MVPLPAELVTGELAVNTSDAVLYTKLADGTIAPVCCGGVAPVSLNGGYFSGVECGPDGCSGMSDVATGIDGVVCAGCMMVLSWHAQNSRCSRQVDYFDIQCSLDEAPSAIEQGGAAATWISVLQVPAGEVLQTHYTATVPRPTPATSSVSVRAVAVSVGGSRTGISYSSLLAAAPCDCDPPPPPPPQRYRCDTATHTCSLESGQPDFVSTFPTLGACQQACAQHWECGNNGSCAPSNCALGDARCYATEEMCLQNCNVTFHCVNGSCQPSGLPADHVTTFATLAECQPHCEVGCGRSMSATCVDGGNGCYHWDPISSPAGGCFFATDPAGCDGQGNAIYTPTGFGHDTGPNGEVYSPYGATFCQWWPMSYCGPCSAENVGASCTMNCGTYNPAP